MEGRAANVWQMAIWQTVGKMVQCTTAISIHFIIVTSARIWPYAVQPYARWESSAFSWWTLLHMISWQYPHFLSVFALCCLLSQRFSAWCNSIIFTHSSACTIKRVHYLGNCSKTVSLWTLCIFGWSTIRVYIQIFREICWWFLRGCPYAHNQHSHHTAAIHSLLSSNLYKLYKREDENSCLRTPCAPVSELPLWCRRPRTQAHCGQAHRLHERHKPHRNTRQQRPQRGTNYYFMRL